MNAKLPLMLIVSGLVAACASMSTSPPFASSSSGRNLPLTTPSAPPSTLPPNASTTQTVVPALTVDHPIVTVIPSTHLKDGQAVQVRVTGFGVGGKVWLSQCASAAAATDLGCGVDLAAQPFLVTDDSEAGSATLVVRASASGRALSAGPASQCVDQCVIVATIGSGYPFLVAPVAFTGP